MPIVSGAAGWCGRQQASLRYSDFIALGHVLVGGTSGSYGSCVFKVVSVLFSIILLVFLQSTKEFLCANLQYFQRF